MALTTTEKVRELRLRRMADRQGLRLSKCRRRDPLALDYNTITLIDVRTGEVRAQAQDPGTIERWLRGEGR